MATPVKPEALWQCSPQFHRLWRYSIADRARLVPEGDGEITVVCVNNFDTYHDQDADLGVVAVGHLLYAYLT